MVDLGSMKPVYVEGGYQFYLLRIWYQQYLEENMITVCTDMLYCGMYVKTAEYLKKDNTVQRTASFFVRTYGG